MQYHMNSDREETCVYSDVLLSNLYDEMKTKLCLSVPEVNLLGLHKFVTNGKAPHLQCFQISELEILPHMS